MVRKTLNKGLGLTGLSLVAALMMSGAVHAQDAGDSPDIVIDEDEVIVGVDDGLVVVDPICIDCMGEGVDGTEGGSDDGWVDDGTDGGSVDDGWVDDGTTDDILVDDGWTGEENPEIYYMSGGGAPEIDHRADVQGQASHRAARAPTGPDLCASPAAEVVWLCDLVNGKSDQGM